jgi:hypothetical protein
MGRAHRSLDVGDRGALIELADAEADQHGRRTRVARELAADGGPDATRVPGCSGAADQLKDGRIERARDLLDAHGDVVASDEWGFVDV